LARAGRHTTTTTGAGHSGRRSNARKSCSALTRRKTWLRILSIGIFHHGQVRLGSLQVRLDFLQVRHRLLQF
jgi:hypothetical protein